jgi:hypothetical protein
MKKLVLSTIVAIGLLAIPAQSPATWTSGLIGTAPAAAKCKMPPPTTRDEQVVRSCDSSGW